MLSLVACCKALTASLKRSAKISGLTSDSHGKKFPQFPNTSGLGLKGTIIKQKYEEEWFISHTKRSLNNTPNVLLVHQLTGQKLICKLQDFFPNLNCGSLIWRCFPRFAALTSLSDQKCGCSNLPQAPRLGKETISFSAHQPLLVSNAPNFCCSRVVEPTRLTKYHINSQNGFHFPKFSE